MRFLKKLSSRLHPLIFLILSLLTNRISQIIQNTSSLLILISLIHYFYYRLPNLYKQIKTYYAQLISQSESNSILNLFVANTLSRVFVSSYFLLFWLIKACHEAIKLSEHNQFYRKPNRSWLSLLIVITNVCNSPISLIATAVTIRSFAYTILFGVKMFLYGLSTRRDHTGVRQSPTFASNDNESNDDRNSERTEDQRSNDLQRQNALYNQSHTGWTFANFNLELQFFEGTFLKNRLIKSSLILRRRGSINDACSCIINR